jgi:hypothetical protein
VWPGGEKKLRFPPKVIKAKIRSVTVPDTEDENVQEPITGKPPTEHTEKLLAKLMNPSAL